MKQLLNNLLKCKVTMELRREARRWIPFSGILGLFFIMDPTTFKLAITMLGLMFFIGFVVHVSRRLLLYFVNLGDLYNEGKQNSAAASMFNFIMLFYCAMFIAGAILLS